MLIKLTEYETNDNIYINSDAICFEKRYKKDSYIIRKLNDGRIIKFALKTDATFLLLNNDQEALVQESPEAILEIIKGHIREE